MLTASVTFFHIILLLYMWREPFEPLNFWIFDDVEFGFKITSNALTSQVLVILGLVLFPKDDASFI